MFERSLAIWEKVHGKEHPLVATNLNNLAKLYKTQGNYDQAKPLFERVLAIREKVFGKEHPSVATSLNNLALLHKTQGNYDQAKPLYERALAIREKVFGKEHTSVATSLNNLATLHNFQSNYEQAKPLYERSLAIREKVLGSKHPSTVNTLNNLATLYGVQGNYAKVEEIMGKTEILVISVLSDSQGEKLGIKAGDIFTHYNGEPISIGSRFADRRNAEPDDSPAKELQILRNSKEILKFSILPGKIGVKTQDRKIPSTRDKEAKN